MRHSEEIDKAIAAHGLWKQRLLTAITNSTSEFSVAQVKVDNRCDFGKWLYGLPAVMLETDDGRNVQNLHAAFHQEAAHVLELALAGRKEDALQALGPGSPYNKLSGQLAIALTQWKQVVDKA